MINEKNQQKDQYTTQAQKQNMNSNRSFKKNPKPPKKDDDRDPQTTT